MCAAIEKSTNVLKKYIYTPPAPPSKLIDSSTYVVDFGNSKFYQYWSLSSPKLRCLYSNYHRFKVHKLKIWISQDRFTLMNDIISIILDLPVKTNFLLCTK